MRILAIISYVIFSLILNAKGLTTDKLVSQEWVAIENYSDSSLFIEDTLTFIALDTSVSEELINNSSFLFNSEQRFWFTYDVKLTSSKVEHIGEVWSKMSFHEKSVMGGQWFWDSNNILTLNLEGNKTVLKYYIVYLDETSLILSRIKE